MVNVSVCRDGECRGQSRVSIAVQDDDDAATFHPRGTNGTTRPLAATDRIRSRVADTCISASYNFLELHLHTHIYVLRCRMICFVLCRCVSAVIKVLYHDEHYAVVYECDEIQADGLCEPHHVHMMLFARSRVSQWRAACLAQVCWRLYTLTPTVYFDLD